MRRDLNWGEARRVVRVAIVVAALLFVAVLLWKNIAPFGANTEYSLDPSRSSGNVEVYQPLTAVSTLGTDEGKVYQVPGLVMETDEVRFGLKVPYDELDSARVRIKYGWNPTELLVGVEDRSRGDYILKPIHSKALNSLAWDSTEDDNLTLYQKNEGFASVDEFLGSLDSFVREDAAPKKASISTYYYAPKQPPSPEIDPDRINDGATVTSALRGFHSFYLYVKGEPLEVVLTLQDLNTYEGGDPLEILVVSGEEVVEYWKIDDDGDETGSDKPSDPWEETIMVEDLEEGAYRVDVVCNEDIIIREIDSSQTYLTFIDQVFIANHDLYGVLETRGSTVYTNATTLDVETWHQEALQTVVVNDTETVVVNMVAQPFTVELPPGVNKVTTEMGDIVLGSPGRYFSFSADSYFDPFPLATVPFNRYFQPSSIDYVIADYRVPGVEGELFVQEVTVPLKGVSFPNHEVDMVLRAPGLVAGGRGIPIDSLEVELVKSGLFE